MKIYVVMEIDSVVAAFSSREQAQEYIYRENPNSYLEIEECEFNPELKEIEKDFILGEIFKLKFNVVSGDSHKLFKAIRYRHPENYRVTIVFKDIMVTSPISFEHAEEIAKQYGYSLLKEAD